ncbi:MAG: alpha/beta hydrolase [Crocinitomicaceae bacterium]|nr:alpha/beta hydrolase [Crocinitomicaceae bacterium]
MTIEKKIQLDSHHANTQFLFADSVKNDATLVVFLHEALGSIPQWRDFPQLLCNQMGMNGIVYDRRGHGKSDAELIERGVDYLHQAAHQELKKLLDILIPLDKKIILVGHSDGGTIALLYAARFPKQVAGIVTMAAHVLVEDETLNGIHPAIEAYKKGKLDGLKKFHGDKTNDLFFAWANTWLMPAFKNWNIVAEINGMDIPTIAIQGREDQYGTEKQIDDIVSALVHVKGVMLDQCKHHPHLEKTKEVIDLIDANLKYQQKI